MKFLLLQVGPIPSGINEPLRTPLDFPVGGVRQVKIIDEIGLPIDASELVSLTIVACEEPTTTTPPPTNATTTPPRPCLSGFQKCYNSEQCMPLVYFCDGEWDCRDKSDEHEPCEPLPTIAPSEKFPIHFSNSAF